MWILMLFLKMRDEKEKKSFKCESKINIDSNINNDPETSTDNEYEIITENASETNTDTDFKENSEMNTQDNKSGINPRIKNNICDSFNENKFIKDDLRSIMQDKFSFVGIFSS